MMLAAQRIRACRLQARLRAHGRAVQRFSLPQRSGFRESFEFAGAIGRSRVQHRCLSGRSSNQLRRAATLSKRSRTSGRRSSTCPSFPCASTDFPRPRRRASILLTPNRITVRIGKPVIRYRANAVLRPLRETLSGASVSCKSRDQLFCACHIAMRSRTIIGRCTRQRLLEMSHDVEDNLTTPKATPPSCARSGC